MLRAPVAVPSLLTRSLATGAAADASLLTRSLVTLAGTGPAAESDASVLTRSLVTRAAADTYRPKVLIVGGVAGGASCAARLRRLAEHADISVFDKGKFVSFANCGLPYYVGDIITAEEKLVVATPELFHRRFNIDVFTQHEVTGVNVAAKSIDVTDLRSGEKLTKPYDALVLSTGASAIIPPVPGVVEKDGVAKQAGVFVLRTIPDSNKIREWITSTNAKSVCVIGAAWAGLEVAEALHDRGLLVNVLELAPQVMPLMDEEMTVPLKSAMVKAGVNLITGEGVAAIQGGEDGHPLHVVTSKGTVIPTDLVILSMGVRVENQLARDAGLTIGVRGSVVVDDCMRTSVPGVWAVGDMVETNNCITGARTNLQLAGPANKQGRVAAEAIAAALSSGDLSAPAIRPFRGVQGTAIAGMFGVTVAMTGLTERMAKAEVAAGRLAADVKSVWMHPGHLVFDGKSGRVYGAQAVGEVGVDKRIDVVAMAIQMRATVMDLAQAELCYSPQFGAAKDPVNIAGMIGSNIVDGLVPLVPWEEVWAVAGSDSHLPPPIVVLDVRYTDEIEGEGPLTAPSGAVVPTVNIPMPMIRGRPECIDALLAALPAPTTPVAVLCREGVRANSVIRVLRQRGVDARLLSGGYYTSRLLCGLPFPPRVASRDDDRFPERSDSLTGACCTKIHIPGAK